MVEIGEILHLAKSGRLIIRIIGNASLKPGELLIGPNGKRVGKVTEIMGSVNAPYASVIPMTDRTNKIIGTRVSSGGFLPRRRDSFSHGKKRRAKYFNSRSGGSGRK